jgi:hypothetical protein
MVTKHHENRREYQRGLRRDEARVGGETYKRTLGPPVTSPAAKIRRAARMELVGGVHLLPIFILQRLCLTARVAMFRLI